MQKIKEIYNFYKDCNWYEKLLILKQLSDLPVIFLHEFSHWITSVLLLVNKGGIKCDHFLPVTEHEKNGVIHKSMGGYRFYVTSKLIQDNKWSAFKNLLVNLSPLYVIFILLYINKLFIFWILLSLKTFLPSKEDILNAKNNLQILIK
jgi:hypothetical protein